MTMPQNPPMSALERIRGLLNYDPKTGIFTWRASGPKRRVGARAGYDQGYGYRYIHVDHHRIGEHRLAWAFVHGAFPENEIDHINLNRADNRIANLRAATRSENQRNTALSRQNTSGIKGVRWDRRTGKWQAQIKVSRKNNHLGYFREIEEAAEARRLAAEKHHGKFARLK